MLPSDAAAFPHARDDAPWSDCGDRRHPDFGTVFAWPAAGRAVALSFDRPGRRHAATLFDGRRLTTEIVLHGRRFDVATGAAGPEVRR
jgi:hypothetical protein